MPAPPEMTVEQFRERILADLGSFVSMWLSENAKNPDHFPTHMPLAEWWEQFEISV